MQPRVVAKLPRKARKAGRLARAILMVAFGTVDARGRVVRAVLGILDAKLASAAVLAVLPLNAAVPSRAARRALGAAHGVGRLASVVPVALD